MLLQPRQDRGSTSALTTARAMIRNHAAAPGALA
jgi:hypothetical protein